MSKVILLTVILLFVGTGLYFYKTSKKPPTATQNESPKIVGKATPTPKTEQTADACEVLTKGSADVPPLYVGVVWRDSKIATYKVPLRETAPRDYSGCFINSGDVTNDMSIKIIDYYTENLQKSVWKNLVSAAGSYSSTDSYQKNNKYFVVKRYANSQTSQKSQDPSIIIELFYSQ